MSDQPAVSCQYCGRCFKKSAYLSMHHNAIISCITKMKIAENDKEERQRIKEITSNRSPAYYNKRWYIKNRDKILQQKKELYVQKKELREEKNVKNNVAIN